MKSINLNCCLKDQPLTASLAAWLLIFYKEDYWIDNREYDMLREAVITTLKTETLPKLAKISSSRIDPRIVLSDIHSCSHNNPILLYSDYSELINNLKTSRISLVDDRNEAEVVLVLEPVKNFLSIPISQKICQFPYEGGLVRKVVSYFSLDKDYDSSTSVRNTFVSLTLILSYRTYYH